MEGNDRQPAHLEEQLFTRRERELLQRDLELTRRKRDMAVRLNAGAESRNNLWTGFKQSISAISELVSEFLANEMLSGTGKNNLT